MTHPDETIPEVIATYKWFRVVRQPKTDPRRKTFIYKVININHGSCIGTISWYGSWRQYCLFPEGDTVWSTGCLCDIMKLIGQLNRKEVW